MTFRIGNGAVKLLRTCWSFIVLFAVMTVWPFSSEKAVVFVVGAVLWGSGWWYVAWWARSLHGSVTARTIYVRYGLVWRREMLIPVTALRAVELWTPPLHRVFRCRTAVLRFAGGSTRIPLLGRDDARRLCAFLEPMEENA